jgi:hypothetical protein
MTTAYKRLGSANPSNTTDNELYLVPAVTQALATVVICNQNSSPQTYSVALTDDAGAATSDEWLCFDKPIGANETHQITGIAMGAAHSIRIKSGAANLISFVAFGMEIT